VVKGSPVQQRDGKRHVSLSPFLLMCVLGGFAIFSSTMSKNPALPLFIRTLNVPIETVGFIAAASTVVGVLISLPAGILSDIIGRRRVLFIAAIIFATAPFLYLLVNVPWQLVIVRVYHGLATAILGPVAMAAVADSFQASRGERMAWYSSATMFGRFLAPFVGGALILGNNFMWVFLTAGVFGVLALTAVVRLPRASFHAPDTLHHRRSWGQIGNEVKFVLTHRGILATSIIEAVQYFGFGALETYLPIYLQEQRGFSTLQIGILFTMQILVATLTKPVMGRLSDLYGRGTLIIGGLILGGISLGVITFSGNFFIIMGIIGLFGLGLATVTASTSALVADLSHATSYGSSLGVLSSIMDIGHSTGPMVAGVLVGSYQYRFSFGVTGAAMIFFACVFPFAMRGTGITSETHKSTG